MECVNRKKSIIFHVDISIDVSLTFCKLITFVLLEITYKI